MDVAVAPVYREIRGICGHSLKIIVALIRRSENGRFGQIDIDDLRAMTGVSAFRAQECLHRLGELGKVRFTYRLGIVDYAVVRNPKDRCVHLDPSQAAALLALGPSDVKLFFAVASHENREDAISFPGVRRLMDMLGRCRRTIQRGLRALQEVGLMAVTKVPWQRVPGWKWAADRRIRRRRVTVFVRAKPSRTRTVSLNPHDPCRGVREDLKRELCLAGAERKVLVAVNRLPEELRDLCDFDESEGSEDQFQRVRALQVVGFTRRQALWLCSRAAGAAIDLALRNLNQRWAIVKNRVRYVIGIVRKAHAAL